MKAKEIRDLIDFISKSGLDEVNIETQEFKIAVRKNSVINNTAANSNEEKSFTETATTLSPPENNNPTEIKEKTQDTNKYLEIKSPMIGTFYRSPNPDTDPFLNEGDTVRAGQTVCIIEAMKLFNEIESEVSGKIVKVLVEDSSPVEFDQPLFLVDPS